jgi:predicted ATPase/class 3 adenylate cyclase
VSCPNCGFDNPEAFAFCGRCGSPTAADKPIRDADGHHSARAERRHLTVMFCDLVGSTELSGQLDPEELHDLMRHYQRICTDVINRHAGHVAQIRGDGLLVYFGYPSAHEDDARRAVRAGLEIVDALARQPARWAKSLHVRIAAHTGLVVVGPLGDATDPDAMAIAGETPNIAARLQGFAEPDTVIISGSTYRLVEGFFLCRSLGAPALKGVAAPIELYSVIEESGIQSRFDQAVATGLTRFVSREAEIVQLLERWERAKGGSGNVVLLSGEAGIGKSRLLRELKTRTAGEAVTDLAARCSPYYQESALYPIIGFLQYFLQFQHDDSAETRLTTLENALDNDGFPLSETVPLFAALLSFPCGERYPPLTMSPQRRKQKTLEALVAWLLKEAGRHPTRVVVEDVHWADPSTLEFLSLLLGQVSQARVFVALVFRSEFVSPWRSQPHVTSISLGRLSGEATERMIESIAGDKRLPSDLIREIATKTEGVPLFIEELTRMAIESGMVRERDDRYELTSSLPSLSIPSTLYESLMARLDRLGNAKQVAQLGATIGKEFSYDLLQAISPFDETELTGALNRLVDAELLNQHLLSPQTIYAFRHALIRDAAYDSLLRSQRRLHHRRIAEILQERFGETVAAQPELLAHHFTEAGLIEQAIPCWQRAGERALERSANREAISHLTKGIELISFLPESAQRLHQELLFWIALGTAEMVAKGFASVEAGKALARARNLCEHVSQSPLVFQVFWMLWVFHEARAEHDQAREAGQECLRLAHSAQHPGLLLGAHHALGASLSVSGHFAEALHHLQRGSAIYDPQQHSGQAYVYGQDSGVACLAHEAWDLWFLGYPDRARERIGDALALAGRLSHLISKAAAANIAWMVYQLLGDTDAAREQANAAVALSTQPEQEFELWRAWGMIGQGWALTESGQIEDGITRLRAGMSALRVSGAEVLLPYFTGLLAHAYGKAKQIEGGLALLAEAESIAGETGERWCLAQLYRLKGELLLKRSNGEDGNGEGAEDCFRRALAIAQEHHAKSLELQAAVSLSRLWRQQGRQALARQVLGEAYSWFTEGFDTPDLREARALIEEA